MSYRIRLLLLLMFVLPMLGQDLNEAWQFYISTNTRISQLEDEKAYYTDEQINIKKTVDELHNSSAWYNAWFNKYLLANYSKRQLVLLDSLRAIEAELNDLQRQQRNEIENLRIAYESLLDTYETDGVLPAEQDIRNLQIGRWHNVMDRFGTILYPDYKEILNLQLKNPGQRKIILIDIQRLLQAKIFELDSIRNDREEEEELALRLASFHEDLGLQMEADQDAQQRDASGNSEKLLGWYAADAASEYADNRDAVGLSNERAGAGMDLISVNVPREDAREMSLQQRSGKDLDYLTQKLTEYEALLEEINEELNQSP
jgi:hypothetical protein